MREAQDFLGFRPGWSRTESGTGGRRLRVLRGGSWGNDDSDNLMSSNRNNNDPDNRNNNIGFRVVRVLRSALKAAKYRPARMAGEIARGLFAFVFSAKKPPNHLIHAPFGENTRRPPWPVDCLSRKSRRSFLFGEVLQPPTGHSSRFVNPADDMDQLLGTDPTPLMGQAPEDPEALQSQVEFHQQVGFLIAGGEDGSVRQQQRIDGEIVDPLSKSESMALRNGGCSVQDPTCQIYQNRVDGRVDGIVH